MVRKTTLGVVTVATNQYVAYWAEQAKSFGRNPSEDLDITLHVFTDQPDLLEQVASSVPIRIVAHRVPSYQWPEATLYRYKLIQEFRELLTEDILMHLDADMLVRDQINYGQLSSSLVNGICLVRHPGTFRPNGLARILLYSRNPLTAIRDLLTRVRVGALGSWETNPDSLAFVSKSARKQYFCGATWWGLNASILGLSEELSSRISRDEENGVVAIWHDESHLNWWASRNEHGQADPRYCYAVGYPQLKGIPIIIQAVDKRALRGKE